MSRGSSVFLLMAVAIGAYSGSAFAKKRERVPYVFADVWPAAVRFLRIDEGFAIAERDEQAGYVVFRFVPPGPKKDAEGSLELVRQPQGTEIFVAMASLPAHHEQALLDRLLAKLRREIAAPPVTVPPKKAPRSRREEPDANGVDAGL